VVGLCDGDLDGDALVGDDVVGDDVVGLCVGTVGLGVVADKHAHKKLVAPAVEHESVDLLNQGVGLGVGVNTPYTPVVNGATV